MSGENNQQSNEQQPDTQQQQQPADKTAQLEAQIAQLQQQVQQATAYATALAQQQQAQAQPLQQPEPPQYDLTDQTQLQAYIEAQFAQRTRALEQQQQQLNARQQEMQLANAVRSGALTAEELEQARQWHANALSKGLTYTVGGAQAQPTMFDGLAYVVGLQRADKALKAATAYTPAPANVEAPGSFAGMAGSGNAARRPKELDAIAPYDPNSTAKLGNYLDTLGSF